MVAEPIVILSWLLSVLPQCAALLVGLVLLIVGGIWVDERFTWNHGKCRRTGNRWKFIRRDRCTGMYIWSAGHGLYQAFYFQHR
ncbi:hypothetical protein D3C72_261890 [compost metagenome]